MKRLFEVDTICRLCLRADKKVCRLNNTDQKVFIESIIKLKQDNYVPTDDLYICYICNALLTKSFNFMQTVWSAQKVICAILKNTNMITKQLLHCIDRHNTGLDPITLSSVVTFCDNVKCNSSNNKSSDRNTSAVIEELDLDFLIKKEEPRKQKNLKINKTNYHSTNEKKVIISISDEDEESDKCNLDEVEVEMCNNFQIDVIKAETSYPLTKELNADKPIPETKKPVIKKNGDLKKTPSNENKLIISISDEDEESDKCNLYETEVEMSINFEIDDTKAESSDPLTKELNTDACEEPIPKTKKTVIKKKSALKEKPHFDQVKSKDSTSNEKKKKNVKKDIDDDYQPDSTSHSEDSDDDSYDDKGKPIQRPKDSRVYPMQCDHCDFEVLEKRNHYRHYQYMHPNIEYPYKIAKDYACSICGKLYGKYKIGSHEAGHTTQKHKCYFCPKVFSSMKRRQGHVMTVHPKKTLTCDYCSKIFKTKGDITRHFRIHTGSKPFKCHICGDGFAHSGNRSIHIRAKHQNNYNYVSKKQKRAQKVHRNKKHRSTDTEISSNSEKTVRKTKKIRKSNNQSDNTEVTPRKKRKSTKGGSKNKELGGTDTAMVSEDGLKNNINIEQGSKNYKNAEIESDDEILAVIKRKNTQDGPQNQKAKQIDTEK